MGFNALSIYILVRHHLSLIIFQVSPQNYSPIGNAAHTHKNTVEINGRLEYRMLYNGAKMRGVKEFAVASRRLRF